MKDEIRLHLDSDVAILRMTRPERRNAMSTSMLESFLEGLKEILRSDATSLVITGSGGVFSGGADVSESVDTVGAIKRMELFCLLYEQVSLFPLPTVAAIEGPCIGGGAEVAGSCDLRAGTADCQVRFPGSVFGIPVGAARLPALIGISRAKDLLMTSRTIDGREAFELGFLNRLTVSEELEEVSIQLARAMAANPGATRQKAIIAEQYGVHDRLSSENRALVRWQRGATGLMGDRESRR